MKNIHRKIMTLKKELKENEQSQMTILDRSGEFLTEGDEADYNSLDVKSKDLQQQISKLETAAENGQDLDDDLKTFKRIVSAGSIGGIPAQPKRQTLSCFSSAKNARDFGLFVLGHVMGNPHAKAMAEKSGIYATGQLEDSNVKGGYLVPSVLANEMIRLVETRGIFRQNSRVIELTSNSLDIPRRSSGTTAYYIGEANAITASDMSLDLVTLTLKKLGVIVPVSSELANDAIISVFDMLAEDIAYSLADKEDEAGFNGDGSGTYGAIVGIRQQLIEKALGGTASGAVPAASGLVRYGTGYAYDNIGIDDLTAMIGKLPTYAEAGAKWYMSNLVWSHMLDRMADAGGNTLQTLADGPGGRRFLGYPVVTVPVMPKAAAVNQVCLLLGDLQKASMMGTQNGVRMETSNSAYVGSTSMFETDQMAIRGIERFDINVHDVGSTTAVGPVIGLISHTA